MNEYLAELNLKAIFTLIDKVSAPIKKIKSGVEVLANQFKKTDKDSKSLTTDIKKSKEEIKKAKEEAAHLKDNIKKASEFGKKLGIFLGAIGSAAVGGFIALGKSVFDVSSRFEKYEAVLTTVLGTQAKAKKAMAWVLDFAAKTPYEVDQVTESFVKMNAYQIDATDGSLEAMGNWASGMGKSLDQAVEALADARTGEFERLKEFGVISKTTGGMVTFSFGNMTKTVKKDAKSIQAALVEIANTKFAGAMLRQSKTAEGILSNLKDFWTSFQKRIGDAGVFQHIKDVLGGFLDKINALPKAQINAWAKKVSDALTRLFDVLFNLTQNVDLPTLINNITKLIIFIVNASDKIGKFVDAIGGIDGIINGAVLLGIFKLGQAVYMVATAFGVAGAAAAPWIVLVMVIAAAAFLIWRNWDKLAKWFPTFWQQWGGWIDFAMSALSPILGFVPKLIATFVTIGPAFQNAINSLWSLAPAWFKDLITGKLKINPPQLPWSKPQGLAVGQYSQNNNSSHNVTLTVPANANANVTKSSGNASLVIKRPLGIQGGGNGR